MPPPSINLSFDSVEPNDTEVEMLNRSRGRIRTRGRTPNKRGRHYYLRSSSNSSDRSTFDDHSARTVPEPQFRRQPDHPKTSSEGNSSDDFSGRVQPSTPPVSF